MNKGLIALGVTALGALTVAKATINATGFFDMPQPVGALLFVAAISSEALAIVFAVKWAKGGGPAPGALLFCCIAFNLIAGHHALGDQDLGFGAGVPHRSPAIVNEELTIARAELASLEALDLTDSLAVAAAQDALAKGGFYSGAIDGRAGEKTTTALGNAATSAREAIAHLEPEHRAAVAAERADLAQLIASLVVIAVFEALGCGGAFALGLHGAARTADKGEANALLKRLADAVEAAKPAPVVAVKTSGRGPGNAYVRGAPGSGGRARIAKRLAGA